jgi:AMMECR1 domain-containing protein
LITIEEAASLIKTARKYLIRDINEDELVSSLLDSHIRNVFSCVDFKSSEPTNWKGIYITIREFSQSPNRYLIIGYPVVKTSLTDAIKLLSHNAALRLLRLQNALNINESIIELLLLYSFRQMRGIKPFVYPRLIDINKNGVLIVRNFYVGIHFPIPRSLTLDPIDMLSECCLNAGLPPDAWLDVNTNVYVFDTIGFREIEPQGEICIE